MTKDFLNIWEGYTTPVSFSAQLIADYEDDDPDRVFIADFVQMFTRYQKTGHFKLSFVARVCYFGVRAAYNEMNEPMPEGITVNSLIERLMTDGGALAAEVVNKMSLAMPQAKNAESPETLPETQKAPRSGKK